MEKKAPANMKPSDPFPMMSKEAAQLSASMNKTNNNNNNNENENEEWNRMGTSTTISMMRSNILESNGAAASAAGGAGEMLLSSDDESGSKRRKANKKKQSKSGRGSSNSIYEEAELDEQRSVRSTSTSSAVESMLLGDDDDDIDDDDDFLDSPLPGRNATLARTICPPTCTRFLRRIHTRLYGKHHPPSETLRALVLSLTLFVMIGGYWLLRSLKDPVLITLCGITVIPYAKILSVFVVLVFVAVYNRLLDSDMPKHYLFYIFGTFYLLLFLIISLCLFHPTIGLPNQNQSPWRILGWISYCSIESFGSIMVSLFWSFANSNFNLEQAKSSYGLLIASGQVGSILGPTVVNLKSKSWGLATCYLIGSFSMLFLQGTMAAYVAIYGTKDTSSSSTKPKKKQLAGIIEGLWLFYKYNFVKGIFAISCLFMIEVTIVDYTMKFLANQHFASLHPCPPTETCWNDQNLNDHGLSIAARDALTTFMGLFGQATNALSLFLSLLGTSAVIRHLGLRSTLLLFPSLCLGVILLVRIRPTLHIVFTAMMMLKACSYALNNPTKEMLYQVTSSDVRYKAKSWIDTFGARGSKAVGSIVTASFSSSASNLVSHGSLVGMAVAMFLIWNARFMGRSFDNYSSMGYIVGSEEEEEKKQKEQEQEQALIIKQQQQHGDDDVVVMKQGVEMAAIQNESEDTSCAIFDNDNDDKHLGTLEEGQDRSEILDITMNMKNDNNHFNEVLQKNDHDDGSGNNDDDDDELRRPGNSSGLARVERV